LRLPRHFGFFEQAAAERADVCAVWRVDVDRDFAAAFDPVRHRRCAIGCCGLQTTDAAFADCPRNRELSFSLISGAATFDDCEAASMSRYRL
jgi:hypothetical protein